ncbi:MAG: RNA 3'-terminal phosphate cyclase, partial [Pyrinomonadaceae bacterium]
SVLTLEGGTHNQHAPPFDFLQKTFLPLVGRVGPSVSLELARYGFYPPGGGRLEVLVEPASRLERLDLLEPQKVRARRATALVVNLPPGIAEREVAVLRQTLGWGEDECQIETSTNAISPGNVVTLEIESGQLTELFSAIGQRGVRAEEVAASAAKEALNYLDAGAPVGEHLADQLLLPLALAAGGSYLTGPLSPHTTTNIEVIRKFLSVEIGVTQVDEKLWRIDVEN